MAIVLGILFLLVLGLVICNLLFGSDDPNNSL